MRPWVVGGPQCPDHCFASGQVRVVDVAKEEIDVLARVKNRQQIGGVVPAPAGFVLKQLF